MTLRILSRLGQMVIVGFVVVVLTFALLHLVPGNPALTILGPRATPQTVAALTQHLHLNRPLLEQFWLYIRSLTEGNLGRSITAAQQPVSSIVSQSLGVTLSLIALTVILSCVLGVCFGVISGMQRGRAPDIGIRSVSIVLLAMPPFVIGFLLLLFALKGRRTRRWVGDRPARRLEVPLASSARSVRILGTAVCPGHQTERARYTGPAVYRRSYCSRPSHAASRREPRCAEQPFAGNQPCRL